MIKDRRVAPAPKKTTTAMGPHVQFTGMAWPVERPRGSNCNYGSKIEFSAAGSQPRMAAVFYAHCNLLDSKTVSAHHQAIQVSEPSSSGRDGARPSKKTTTAMDPHVQFTGMGWLSLGPSTSQARRMGSGRFRSAPKRGRVSLVQWQGGASRAGLLSARLAPTQPMDQAGAPPFCPMRLA